MFSNLKSLAWKVVLSSKLDGLAAQIRKRLTTKCVRPCLNSNWPNPDCNRLICRNAIFISSLSSLVAEIGLHNLLGASGQATTSLRIYASTQLLPVAVLRVTLKEQPIYKFAKHQNACSFSAGLFARVFPDCYHVTDWHFKIRAWRLGALRQIDKLGPSEENKPHGKSPYIDESLVINSRLKEIERRQEEEKKEERQYKERQLRFTRWTVIFAGLLFLTSLVSDIVLIVQAKSARDSADAAQSAAHTAAETLRQVMSGSDVNKELAKAAEKQAAAAEKLGEATTSQNKVLSEQIRATRIGQLMQDRPWLELVSIQGSGPIYLEVNGLNFNLVFNVKNTGHAPALNVNLMPVIFNGALKARNGKNRNSEQSEACSLGRKISAANNSDTLFPDQPLIQPITVTINSDDIKKSIIPNFVFPEITGCVTYVYPSDKTIHQTGFHFDAVYKDPVSHSLLGIPTDKVISRLLITSFAGTPMPRAGRSLIRIGTRVAPAQTITASLARRFQRNQIVLVSCVFTVGSLL